MADETVSVRYMVHDVDAAVTFYESLGFGVATSSAPTFADVTKGNLRLRLSGMNSSAGRPTADGRQPEPGGWNRIYVTVDDLPTLVDQLRAGGAEFRSEITNGPSGAAILVDDPSGNPIELIQPASS